MAEPSHLHASSPSTLTLKFEQQLPDITQQEWVSVSFDGGQTWDAIGYLNKLKKEPGVSLFGAIPAFCYLAQSDKEAVICQMEQQKQCKIRVSEPPRVPKTLLAPTVTSSSSEEVDFEPRQPGDT